MRSAYLTQEQGQELVEFAILLPLLVLIVFGVLDLGRVFFAAITITNAARVGARYGMAYPGDEAGIITVAQAEAQGSGLDLTNPTVSAIDVSCPDSFTPDVLPCPSGDAIRVTIAYTFTLIIGSVLPDPEIPISRYAEMIVP